MSIENYYTTEQVREKLGYAHDSSVRYLILQEILKAVKVGGVWLVPIEEVERLSKMNYGKKNRDKDS
jgi:hypothetical protein